MTAAGLIFVVSFVGLIYFAKAAFKAWQSPEFKRDMERLREQRRRRKASRR